MMKQRHLLVAVLAASFVLLDIVLADTAPEGKSDVHAPAPAAAVNIGQQPGAKDAKKTPTVGLVGPEWTWPKHQKQVPAVGLVGPEWTWPRNNGDAPVRPLGLIGPEWTWRKNKGPVSGFGAIGPEWTWSKHSEELPIARPGENGGGLPPILRGGGRGKNRAAGLGRSMFNGGIVPPVNLPPGLGTGSLRPRLGAPSIPGIIDSGRKHKKPCWRNKRKCVGKPVTGPCRAAMPMFYYDKASNTCRQFTYGGCGGNNNRWIHHKNCESVCVNRKKPSRCRNKYGEIVLVKPKQCPVRKCTRYCRYGYQRDKNGCRTCYCLKRQNKPTRPYQQNKPAGKHLAIDFQY